MIYQFKCAKCERTVDVQRSVAERDEHPTPEEFGDKCQVIDKPHQWARQILKSSFVLQGGGWFKSDGGY